MTRTTAPAVTSLVSRRTFVQGLAGSALLLPVAGGTTATASDAATLTGTDFELAIGTVTVDLTGRRRSATLVNGRLPGPVLRWREGDVVSVRVANHLPVPTSIHWHGMIVPADMDGVPGLSFHGIPPGGVYRYRFRVNQSGTYWYHSHSRFQEQTGLYGAIIVSPRGAERHPSARDYVVLLSDWTDADPEHVYRLLKVHPQYFNHGQRTLADTLADAHRDGWPATLAERGMWGRVRMDPTDLADVSGYTYTYLMNGVTPQGNWTGLFQRGEQVRLRFINGSSMSFFDVRIPGLKLRVVAADGQDVEPVSVDEFRIGTAEVLDVIVAPADRPYTIFAQAIDRSGYACGTLAPQPGLRADVPRLDARPLLSMSDMGMSGSIHGMSSMSMADGADGEHAAADYGPTVDMQVLQPQTRLDDPGVGLRNNGRRVLTYADLHTLDGSIDARAAARDIELHLTGHMQRFIWSFNGQKFSASEPLRFNYGERLRLVLVNDTMMNHPIHLHGMWGELLAENGDFLVRKHTITVQPAQRLSYLVTADALGRWAYHCHLLYHMEAGMFREVVVERPGTDRAG
jgi:FtsP/CotA-like multicopper oxidase with cupredoxin domain